MAAAEEEEEDSALGVMRLEGEEGFVVVGVVRFDFTFVTLITHDL